MTNADNARDTTPLALRPHTILGVCEGVAEDLGFNPIWLRIPFAAMVLWSPLYVIAAYFGLGLVVLATRLVFPDRAAAISFTEVGGSPSPTAGKGEARLPLAA